MSDIQNESNEPKKISLADAIKNKLAQKKQAQSDERAGKTQKPNNGLAMKSQQTKKINNQRRRTGGS